MLKGDKKNRGVVDSPERLNRLVNGTNLTGDISTESSLRIDGSVNGTINCSAKFVLGTTGVLTGDLLANEAEIEGSIEGDVNVEDLIVLRKTAVIKGTVTTGRLVIEDGAQFGGTITTGDVKTPKSNHSKNAHKTNETHKKKQEPSDVVY